MANRSVNPQAEAPATHTGEASPALQPFNLHPVEVDRAALPGQPVRKFAEHVSAVASGVRVILELALDDQQRKECREVSDETEDRSRPLFAPDQVWSLQRLALFALEGIEGGAERLMEWAYETHTAEGKEASNKREG